MCLLNEIEKLTFQKTILLEGKIHEFFHKPIFELSESTEIGTTGCKLFSFVRNKTWGQKRIFYPKKMRDFNNGLILS